MSRLRVRAYRPWGGNRSIALVLVEHHPPHFKPLVGRMVMDAEPREEDSDLSDAALYLSIEHAQALMDDLWTCGLRPTEGAGSAGALAATQRHLEDMRTLALKGLG